jgi:hypothetical protein
MSLYIYPKAPRIRATHDHLFCTNLQRLLPNRVPIFFLCLVLPSANSRSAERANSKQGTWLTLPKKHTTSYPSSYIYCLALVLYRDCSLSLTISHVRMQDVSRPPCRGQKLVESSWHSWACGTCRNTRGKPFPESYWDEGREVRV